MSESTAGSMLVRGKFADSWHQRTHLDDDPSGRRRGIHKSVEKRPELLEDLARDVDEEWQRAPGNPLWLGCEGVHDDARIPDEIRVTGRL